MTEFKKEPRYIVFKIKDLELMDDSEGVADYLRRLGRIGSAVAHVRRERGKPPFNCVVVEQDWPEFEIVWALIEARMTGQEFWKVIEAQLADPNHPITFNQLRPLMYTPSLSLVKAAYDGGKGMGV